MTAVPNLECSDLTVRYGSLTALHEISLTLGAGVIGLLGPNGAGKSTMLRVLATAQRPSSGRVTGCGVDFLGPPRPARRLLGYLPQDPGSYPHFKVRDYLNHFALLKEIAVKSERAAEIDRVIAAVGLQEKAKSKVKALSGGMKQRLALGCALLGDPPILILDEPTVGLDPQQRGQFREIIADLGENHLVLLSTHQTEDVTAVCDRVLVLARGSILFDGSPPDLAEVASGRVWLSHAKEPAAIAGWRTGQRQYRNLGQPPASVELGAPTLDDGYLVLLAEAGESIEVPA